jgi:two-component system alkaline phosphatase synthesis response regulator PhoP
VEAPRILVVDDDPNMLLLIRFNLERRGWTVVTAEDGPTGLELATGQRFDVVILDLMLPGMSGFDVCRGLRAGGESRDVPVLMLTARSQMDDFEEASRVGATDYLLKPFDPMALMEQVAAHLASRSGSGS